MKITMIGHGNVGSSLWHKWFSCGHQIAIAARDTNAEKLLEFRKEGMEIVSIHESLENTDVIVYAAPAHSAVDIAKQIGELPGKIIIDTSNSVFKKPEPYPTAFAALQDLTKADLVKCFNSTGVENMQNPSYSDSVADMFVAGNSVKGKEIAVQLAKDLGFAECYNFGGDDKVPLLEQLCAIWINLAMQ